MSTSTVQAKSVIEITDRAAAALMKFLGPGTVNPAAHPLRVTVNSPTEEHFNYEVGFANDPDVPEWRIDERLDVISVSKGFPLAVRRDLVPLLEGTTIDYEVGSEGAGFRFRNPNEVNTASGPRLLPRK
jgi:Fe-S cluster assembly iron-binding protein IscA